MSDEPKLVDSNAGSVNTKTVIKNKEQRRFGAFFIFLVNKTERIISAVYLITNIMSDREPIKWEIRRTAISALTTSHVTLSESRENSDRIKDIYDLFSECLSFLGVARLAGLVTDMNYGIVAREVELLQRILEDRKEKPYESKVSDKILDTAFFDVSKSLPVKDIGKSGILAPRKKYTKDINVKDSSAIKDIRINNSVSDIKSISKGQEHLRKLTSNQLSNRRSLILGFLKSAKEASLRDFCVVIKDCSEKTIQRELVSLVYEGVLKKEGEKRWSRYSFVL